MNDFTKEELETLAACVSTYCKDDPDDYMPLFDKICFLINNHCENELYCTCCNSEQKHIYCANCKKSMKKVIE